MKPKALILFASGTNRDGDASAAFELAGAETYIRPLKQLRQEKTDWSDYQILVLPGGFSYADALGAGKIFALDLSHYFVDQVRAFVDVGKAVIGICNGFQALVKSGILPDMHSRENKSGVTLTFNQSNHFECRWVSLKSVSKTCIWTRDLTEVIDCPVAHGEGNFQSIDSVNIQQLAKRDQIALVYSHPDGSPADGLYPINPNGSVRDIAGISNPQGNVLGLMPHPENHIFPFQSPDRANRSGFYGLPLFINGVRYAQDC